MGDGAVRLERDENLVGVARQRRRQLGAAVAVLLSRMRSVLPPDRAQNLPGNETIICC